MEPFVHYAKEKILARRCAGKKVFDFSQALVSMPPPPKAIEVIRTLDPLDPSLHALGPVPGLQDLREEIARYRQEVYMDNLNANNVVVTAGANHAFLLVTMVLTSGVPITGILSNPYFFNHATALHYMADEIKFYSLKEKEGFQPDMATLQKVLSDEKLMRSIIALTNPNNPTGVCMDGGSLAKIEDVVANGTGKRLIIDESYAGFDYRDPQLAAAKFNIGTTIVIGSFSKSFSLASWRVGYIIADTKLIPEIIKVQDASIICPGIAAQRIALAALQDRDPYFKHRVARLGEKRKRLLEGLSTLPCIEDVYGNGAVFLFAKLRDNADCSAVAEDILDQFGIATIPGSAFGDGGKGYLRFAYGIVNEEEIDQACELLGGYK